MCSLKKGLLKNLAKVAEKHLCQILIFNKIAGLRPATSLKKEALASLAQLFSCEFCEIFKNTFFIEHLRKAASKTKFFSFSPFFLEFWKILVKLKVWICEA